MVKKNFSPSTSPQLFNFNRDQIDVFGGPGVKIKSKIFNSKASALPA